LPLLASGPGQSSAEYTVPLNALAGVAPEARASAYSGVLAIACPGALELDLAAAGDDVGGLLPFRCTDASGAALGLHDSIVGVKRVFLRERDRNANPVIAAVTFDGEPWAEGDVKQV